MDLNLISRRLGDGEYDSSRSCFRDLLMVARNSYLYSQPSSKFHEAANLLKERLEALRERARHIGPGNGYEVNQTSSQATGQKTLNSFEDNGFLSTPAAEQAQGLFGVAEDKNLLSVQQFRFMPTVGIDDGSTFVRDTLRSLQPQQREVVPEKRQFHSGAFQVVEGNASKRAKLADGTAIAAPISAFQMIPASSAGGAGPFFQMHPSMGRVGPMPSYGVGFPGPSQGPFRPPMSHSQGSLNGNLQHMPTMHSAVSAASQQEDVDGPADANSAEAQGVADVMKRLLQTLKRLGKEGKLNSKERQTAKELALCKHEGLISCFQLYEEDCDEDDFIDSLKVLRATSSQNSETKRVGGVHALSDGSSESRRSVTAAAVKA
mmetsp:Transcript_9379/g.25470  ORF Transcript_9379/g.25470 Transcript_9379/m.25470 type:complete len:376 (+) Transcript_9379:427-1554(+)